MNTLNQSVLPIRTETDVVIVRQKVRAVSVELKFSLVDQTKIVTAASELARNVLNYGGGGTVAIEVLIRESKNGLRLTFEDQGPGIPDIELALQDGYTTGGGLGMGLGGARRLVNEFEITSRVGEGTRVVITRWK
ncbi:anti-sigma regulatory factor [Oligoflexus tunisiensis]|uniref:anti-sigma regulatory factor n=1 Tax=Oligoflexus tunisiensis TaxID=708132 RepID=UPI00114D18CE|nr:anti-sigma regulatory factor [Oligoflexus tunisiensis]